MLKPPTIKNVAYINRKSQKHTKDRNTYDRKLSGEWHSTISIF